MFNDVDEHLCVLCQKRPAVKTDGLSRPICLRCAKDAVGTIRATRRPPRRNAPCPCGSGKKYKHCHMRVSA